LVSCTAYVWILIMQHCEEILLCVCWSEAGVPLSERTVGAWTVPMGWGVGTYTSTFEFIAWRCFAHVNDSLKLIVSQSVSGTLDRPRVVAPSKTCGHVRSSRRRCCWAQCRPRSAAPTLGRVVLAGASTPGWCPVYRLHDCSQPAVVWSGLVSLPVVAARDQKWRVASDKSGLLSFLY